MFPRSTSDFADLPPIQPTDPPILAMELLLVRGIGGSSGKRVSAILPSFSSAEPCTSGRGLKRRSPDTAGNRDSPKGMPAVILKKSAM